MPKTTQSVRIIASKPAVGQSGIESYIGKVFPVLRWGYKTNDEMKQVRDGTVIINLDGCGESVLQKGEYEITEA